MTMISRGESDESRYRCATLGGVCPRLSPCDYTENRKGEKCLVDPFRKYQTWDLCYRISLIARYNGSLREPCVPSSMTDDREKRGKWIFRHWVEWCSTGYRMPIRFCKIEESEEIGLNSERHLLLINFVIAVTRQMLRRKLTKKDKYQFTRFYSIMS